MLLAGDNRSTRVLNRLTALCIFALSCLAAGNSSANSQAYSLDDYLRASDVRQQRTAYDYIVANRPSFLSRIRSELFKSAQDPLGSVHLDRLIYLAAIVRDPSLVEPLVKIFSNASYVEESCTYACPIVLALANYELSGVLDRSKVNLPGTTATTDLSAVVKDASVVSLEKTKPQAKGPGIDGVLAKAGHLSESKLIRQAGPETKSPQERLAAAYWLGSTVSTDNNLLDLYWLAIQELNDDSADYRSAIYNAIYRAERARRGRTPANAEK